MKTPKSIRRVRHDETRPFVLRAIETNDLPAGVCGRIVGIGLRYNQPDWYDTLFRPGCLAKTAEKVRAGKVKFLQDHRGGTDNHIGVVRSVEDVGEDVLVRADLFDTDVGRRKLEYAKAVLAAGAQTGLSIGFYERASEPVEVDGRRYLAFTEVELEEFSLTPQPAVEGADLLAARTAPAERQALLRTAFDTLLQSIPEAEVRAAVEARFGSTSTGNATDPQDSADSRATSRETRDAHDGERPGATPAQVATMDDRLTAVRHSLSR